MARGGTAADTSTHAAINGENFARNHGHTHGAVHCVWCAILIGFFAMLRKDGIFSGKARTFVNISHCLIHGDLRFVPQTQALWLRCIFIKTNQFNGRQHVVPLQYTGGILLISVTAYNTHVADYPSTYDLQPAFMYHTKGKRVIALSHTFLAKGPQTTTSGHR